MDPVTLGLISMGIGGAIKGFGGLFDDSASKKAGIMRQEANLTQTALEETMRRAEGSQTQVLSDTKARMAATGFSEDSKSFTNYLTGMAAEFQKQNDFTRQQGMASIDLQRQAANVTEDTGIAKFLQFGADITNTGAQIAGIMK